MVAKQGISTMKIQIKGLERLRQSLDMDELLAKDFGPRAVADAINHTAFAARKVLQSEMTEVFDRPTPWTLKSLQVKKAKAGRGSVIEDAAIYVSDYAASKDNAPEAWLKAEVYGGQRRAKRLEEALRYYGILPPGHMVMPGKGARLDSYGNFSKGHMSQMLSGLGAAEMKEGLTANASQNKQSLSKGNAKAFFVIRRGKTAIGIAERRGKTMAVVLVFIRKADYARRFRFHEIVEKIADRYLLTNLDEAIVKAMG